MKPHRARILAVQGLYQAELAGKDLKDLARFDWVDFNLPEDETAFALELIGLSLQHQGQFDDILARYSRNWDVSRISPVSRAILHLSLAQFLHRTDIPPRVVFDEALKLSREYAEDDANRFINGVLDAFYRAEISHESPAESHKPVKIRVNRRKGRA